MLRMLGLTFHPVAGVLSGVVLFALGLGFGLPLLAIVGGAVGAVGLTGMFVGCEPDDRDGR